MIYDGRVTDEWVKIEEELSAIGENQKQLEISEEKARRREEKYQVLLMLMLMMMVTMMMMKARRRKEKYQVLLLYTPSQQNPFKAPNKY